MGHAMLRLFSVKLTEIVTGGQWKGILALPGKEKGEEERFVLGNVIEEGGYKQHGFRVLLRSGEVDYTWRPGLSVTLRLS